MSDSSENYNLSEYETENKLRFTNQPGNKPLKRGIITFINTKLVAALMKIKCQRLSTF